MTTSVYWIHPPEHTDISGSTVLTLPSVSGSVLSSTAVSTSVLGTVTNKITINIGGTTYYLLASTSGV